MRSMFHEWKNSCATVPSSPLRWPGLRSAPAAREHGAVAMLHAVAARPRQIVGQKRVGVVLELRELAEDRHRLADDPLDVAGEGVGIGVGAVVMQRDAEGRRRLAPAGFGHAEGAQRDAR